MNKTWLITGCSRGFGRIWAQAALDRGDRVIATARDPQTLAGLEADHGERVFATALDVRDRDHVRRAVRDGVKVFGGIDVVVNNAGYGLFCPVEDIGEQDATEILQTNLLGSLRVIQETLPVLRDQGHGHIVQISSIAGLISLPGMGMYNATKWAVEGLVEALAVEVAEFGVRVTIVEPGAHLTDWIGASAVRPARGPAYPEHEEYMRRFWPRMVPADPRDTVGPLLDLVDSADPPLRLPLGAGVTELITEAHHRRLDALAGAGRSPATQGRGDPR